MPYEKTLLGLTEAMNGHYYSANTANSDEDETCVLTTPYLGVSPLQAYGKALEYGVK